MAKDLVIDIKTAFLLAFCVWRTNDHRKQLLPFERRCGRRVSLRAPSGLFCRAAASVVVHWCAAERLPQPGTDASSVRPRCLPCVLRLVLSALQVEVSPRGLPSPLLVH